MCVVRNTAVVAAVRQWRWRLLSHSAEAGMAGKLVKLLRPIWVPCYAIMIMMKGLTRIVRGLVG